MPVVPPDQSYQDFVRLAFTNLVNWGPAWPNDGVAVSVLYHLYCHHNFHFNIQAKAPLTGNQLNQAMINLINSVTINNRNHVIRIQDDNLNVMNQRATLRQYRNPPQNMSRQARRARRSYLHVYPYGTTVVQNSLNQITLPNTRNYAKNWRIGINVFPNSMAAAVQALVPIMDQNLVIDHMKFMAPGRADKSDSVIIFLRKQANNYGNIRIAVGQAMVNAQVQIQRKFSPMWNEFDYGYGEAAEAPTNGYSFGMFRCILAYLAYPRRLSTVATLRLADYQARVDEIFETFGIPLFAPHEQGQLILPPFNDPLRIRFMRALALYRNFGANVYQNLLLVAR